MTAPMLESYVAGGWFAATDDGARIADAVTGETVVRVSSTGLDVPAMLDHARTVGGPALRELTFHQRAGLLKQLGLINTWWGVIVPGMASFFGIFLIRQYALSIPESLLEAARIDGAGEFKIYWLVVLPICRPILVTLAIFTFMSAWNDFMWPLIVLTDEAMYTLPVALANLLGEHVQDTELMMAGSVVTILPVMLLFIFVQRAYIDGITAGSLKE